MIKQYLGDGFIQIAILLSLLRTDLNNLAVPNNEILNYPEVQDILQGQTIAYLPTSFHNQYNSLHSLHGYQNPKHIDDIFFSSIFNNWRFRRLSTNIEAFLVSGEEPYIVPVAPIPQPEQSNAELQTEHVLDGDAENNQHGTATVTTASFAAESAQGDLVDANHNNVVIDSEFSHPFPGLGLSKEDLDLIEVLWRQDVDLGVGKEVFDPNLRKELEQEREIEQHKELEKRKEAEKRERERQQQAQQWLSQNFVRDGETGELMPIAGNSFSTSGHSSLYSDSTFPATLEEALNFVGELQANHTYGQPPPQQQQPVAATVGPSNPLPTDVEDIQYLPEPFVDDGHGHNNYANHTVQERLEQSWKEVVEQIFTDNATSTAPSSDQNPLPPTEDPSLLLPGPDPATASYLGEPHVYQQTPPPPPPQHPLPQLNASMDYLLGEQNHSTPSPAASMGEMRRLLQRHNSTDMGQLTGLLQNASLPLLALDSNLSVLDIQPMAPDTDMVSSDFNNSVNPAHTMLPPLDMGGSDLLFHNASDLSNITGAITPNDFLNTTDLLTEMLPMDALDITMDEAALSNIQMLEEGGSDSAISLGSGSPEQEVNETMQMSPFDGLEGATGGSEYDSNSYGHHRSHMHSSGSTEEENYQYSCSSYGSPASVSTNCSTGSNDTEHSSGHSSTSLHHIHHNHTYPTQPGHTPREVKKYAKKEGPRQKGPQSRDRKRAHDLKLPYTFDQIVGSPVEEFNDIITKSKLSDAQIALMRDIRRRGKNKVAAQNCRKRKLDVLTNLEEEMGDMQRMRDKLAEERRQIDLQTRQAKEKYAALYEHIFNSLRDEEGRPYNPAEYSLQESSDGNVFLVRKSTGSATSPAVSSTASSPYPLTNQSSSASPPSSSSSSSSSSSGSKRGKDFDPQQHKNSSHPHKKKSRE